MSRRRKAAVVRESEPTHIILFPDGYPPQRMSFRCRCGRCLSGWLSVMELSWGARRPMRVGNEVHLYYQHGYGGYA